MFQMKILRHNDIAAGKKVGDRIWLNGVEREKKMRHMTEAKESYVQRVNKRNAGLVAEIRE